MTITAIWAQSKDGVIGDGQTMPWHVPEDLAFFRRTTMGGVVIMGRHTWDGLAAKFRPLPGRSNIVISSVAADNWSEGARVASSIDEAFDLANREGKPIFVIGGGKVYSSTIERCDKLIVTVIDCDLKDALGDSAIMAPVIDETKFTLTRQDPPAKQESGGASWTSSEGSIRGYDGPVRYRVMHYLRRAGSRHAKP